MVTITTLLNGVALSIQRAAINTNFANLNAVSGLVSQGAQTVKTLDASGDLALTGPGTFTVAAYSGTADTIESISGLAVGEQVTLSPDTGDTITVENNSAICIRADFPMDSVYDCIVLECVATGIVRQVARNKNA